MLLTLMAGSFVASAGPRETCDGVDTNDDGYDAPAWFPDADGDRFGRTMGRIFRCVRPIGYASRAGDCDDTDELVNPAATEVCNDIDDDCDGEIDPDSLWYIDYDGDGWGFYDVAYNVESCDQPVGYAAEWGDCDNNDPSVNPGTVDGCVCDGYDGVCVTCGDGVVDSGEECDGSELDGQDCESQGYDAGTLSCSSSCTLDTHLCFNGGGGGGGGGTTSGS